MRRTAVATAMACGIWMGLPGSAPAQDIMSACGPEIGKHCADISRGRGRILACLLSHDDRLSASCKSDVMATAQKGSRNPLVPSGVRTMMTTGAAANVPAVCSGDVASFCAGVSPGNERKLACLFANSGRVSRDCAAQVRAALQ